MAEKKKFLLRIDEKIYAALEKWAADELRSINAQIEFILTDALKKSGRMPQKDDNGENSSNPNP
ncbi:MAG: Arc family DNA-binding protein [Ignavibacterium sp.]